VTGVLAAIAIGGGASTGTVAIGDLTVSIVDTISPVTAYYTLDPSGSILEAQLRSLTWIAPQVGMDQFQARVSNVTGATLTSGTVNSWLTLTASRSWELEQSVIGSSSSTFLVEIRRTSDSVVVDSANVTLTAQLTP